MSHTLFTSESVSEGHPDKLADQISDAILDSILIQDENARVAAETLITRGLVVLAGEISTDAHVNYAEVARETIKLAGYDHCDLGLDYQGCGVLVLYEKQSSDISSSVHHGKGRSDLEHMGAGDQGIMFGYATNETSGYMPLPILLAHRLMQRQAHLRKDGRLLWLGPDAKSQVTVAYHNGRPVQVTDVLISTQHLPDISNTEISEAVIEEIIKPCLTEKWLNNGVNFLVNPSGRFVSGGPYSDCGLTGRKIVVDTYGGFAPHGGGAFSGKDPSKVDRSATYMARYIAKNLVAAGLVERCLIQLSYVIGQPNPASIMVDSFGTSLLSEEKLIALITHHFDLSVPGIIRSLDLLRPIYKKTSVYGHFGRDEPEFSWEALDKVMELRESI